MGWKKYFCDYCQKAFNDDPKARSLHMNSARHLQLKDEHYRIFKSPKEVLQAEIEKGPCKMYHRTGDCRFGASCRFSHFLDADIEMLRWQVDGNITAYDEAPTPSFNEWYSEQKSQNRADQIMSHTTYVPAEQLPPSLRPFDVSDYLQADLPSWG